MFTASPGPSTPARKQREPPLGMTIAEGPGGDGALVFSVIPTGGADFFRRSRCANVSHGARLLRSVCFTGMEGPGQHVELIAREMRAIFGLLLPLPGDGSPRSKPVPTGELSPASKGNRIGANPREPREVALFESFVTQRRRGKPGGQAAVGRKEVEA